MTDVKTTVIAADTSWIEGAALQQLHSCAQLPGMRRAVGLPDLHPGKGIPVGAAFLTDGIVYPHLVGNDIGCGMALWQTDLSVTKFKPDKVVKKLTGLEQAWGGDTASSLSAADLPTDLWPHALGTIGGGNHFAEFQQIEAVSDACVLAGLGLDPDRICLLVHSGSRGLGEAILRKHVDQFGASGLALGTAPCDAYLLAHDQAVQWGIVNRAIIAERFLNALRADATRVLDVCHNSVTRADATNHWLHRKGAAPSDQGAIVIPGSRATLSYLVMPVDQTRDISLSSLAHGAGRKWKRSDAKARLSKRYRVSDLERTKLGGRVICEDKALIYEEAPEAYKNVGEVITDLHDAGLIRIVSTYRPVVSYKTRRQ